MREKKPGRPFKTEPSIAAAKLLRVLKFIRMLENERVTIEQIEKRFDVSKRTVYRYVALLEEAGYVIDKDFHRHFFITK